MKKKIFLTIIGVLVATVTFAQNERVVDDRIANQLFISGELHDSILTLQARRDYMKQPLEVKTAAVEVFMRQFPGCKVVVSTERGENELWYTQEGKAAMVDSWRSYNMQLADFMRKEDKMKKYGRWYYYVGGSFSGTVETANGSVNLRGGTFLFKDIIDASAMLNLGFSKATETSFTGDLGVSSRAYWPIRKISLAPYLGVGVSWAFAPSMYFEFQAFTGVSWFVGPGSLDVGFRYGIKSSWAITIGYSFHPSYIKSMKDAKNKKAVNNQ